MQDVLPPGAPDVRQRITLEQLAKRLQLTPQTVRKLSLSGGLPRPIRCGRRLLWDPAEVEAHLATLKEGKPHGA